MSPDEVNDSGAARAVPGAEHDGYQQGCHVLFYLPGRLGQADGFAGLASSQRGLEQLQATDRMVTPEGIRLGSTIAEVSAAYSRPNITAGDYLQIPASSATVYRMQMSRKGRVQSLSVERRTLLCSR